MPKPSLSRAVHVVRDGKHYAAVVTAVHSDQYINALLFSDGSATSFDFTGGTLLLLTVERDDTGTTEGTWHFPEYVPDEVPVLAAPAPAEVPAPPAA